MASSVFAHGSICLRVHVAVYPQLLCQVEDLVQSLVVEGLILHDVILPAALQALSSHLVSIEGVLEA